MKVHESTPVETLHGWGEDIFPKLSWFKRHKVKQARVMVVGCGALGNEVLKNLALFGVGQLVIVDFDEVEYSNLTRSVLFCHEDVKSCSPKVEAAARRIREMNPHVKVTPIQGDIGWQVGLGLIRRMDVVVGCLDNRQARYWLNRLCMRAGVPWVDGGMEGLEGVAKVYAPGKNCYACTLEPGAWKALSKGMSCASVIRRNEQAERVPTTPVVASVIGAVQAQEAMKLIHKKELEKGELTSLCGKMFYYEGQHLTSRLIEHRGWDDDCPVHEQWEPVIPCALTHQSNIKEWMEHMKAALQEEKVEIVLRNQPWVDYIELREKEGKIPVGLPAAKVQEFVERHSDWRHIPVSAFYQHEYRCVGADFPCMELTLEEIGIPDWEVLHVRTGTGECYVELTPLNLELTE